MQPSPSFDLLLQLLAIDSPTGDEHVMADWLHRWIGENLPGCAVTRLRDCLVAVRGASPTVAVFAHIDTIGFTVGHGGEAIPIGSPHADAGLPVRVSGADPLRGDGRLALVEALGTDVGTDDGDGDGDGERSLAVAGIDPPPAPGDRLVFAPRPLITGCRIRSPYLDNRGGVWAALEALRRSESIAVAFTTGEEVNASGAVICARYLYDTLGVTQALISDITWDTEHVHCGQGVAVSLRDRLVPSQRFAARVARLAEGSGIAHQIEIESAGGSDGGGIERSGCPIDWLFVGAPEERPHTPTEELDLNDLEAMAAMLAYLAARL